MARVLQFRRPEPTTVQGQAATKDVKETAAVTTTTPDEVSSSSPAAVFEQAPGQTTSISAPVEGAALSQLIARLKARGDGAEQSATVGGPAIVQTAEGKVLSGSVQIESRAGLQKYVEGVTRVGGDLAISGVMKNADLLALRDLKTIEGRLDIEGLRSRPPIE
jgi:hypothetical protein